MGGHHLKARLGLEDPPPKVVSAPCCMDTSVQLLPRGSWPPRAHGPGRQMEFTVSSMTQPSLERGEEASRRDPRRNPPVESPRVGVTAVFMGEHGGQRAGHRGHCRPGEGHEHRGSTADRAAVLRIEHRADRKPGDRAGGCHGEAGEKWGGSHLPVAREELGNTWILDQFKKYICFY